MSMEAATRRRLIQKVKSIYYSLRSLLCFFGTPDPTDSLDYSDPVKYSGHQELSGDIIKAGYVASGSGELDTTSEDVFPFELLPEDCQLQVFSYLSAVERGRASAVCKTWNALLGSSGLWSSVDLTSSALGCGCRGGVSRCVAPTCYRVYKRRVHQYVAHLRQIRPNLRRLTFAFDIGDCADDWLELLQNLLSSVRCFDLAAAHLNWKETPMKLCNEDTASTGSVEGFNDVSSRHRRRQRLFTGFFDFLTRRASNIIELAMPFDWSPPSLNALSRLERLQVLSLDTYFVPQPVDPQALDLLLSSAPRLRRLTMSVCLSSGAGLVTFGVHSTSLEHLDVSHCHGMCLGDVEAPRLQSLCVGLKPDHGPLGEVVSGSSIVKVPCIIQVLRRGAPALSQLNGVKLKPGWSETYDEELEVVIRNVCPCVFHRLVRATSGVELVGDSQSDNP